MKVAPGGILGLDQRDLSRATPALDLLFASDGGVNVRRMLHEYQGRDVVPTREARRLNPMFCHATDDIAGHADVQDGSPPARVGQNDDMWDDATALAGGARW